MRERLRVLIVDDQPPVVKALSVLLDLNDLPHAIANTPDEALAVARAEPLAAVVQDMNFRPNETSGEAGAGRFPPLPAPHPGPPGCLPSGRGALAPPVARARQGAAPRV